MNCGTGWHSLSPKFKADQSGCKCPSGWSSWLMSSAEQSFTEPRVRGSIPSGRAKVSPKVKLSTAAIPTINKVCHTVSKVTKHTSIFDRNSNTAILCHTVRVSKMTTVMLLNPKIQNSHGVRHVVTQIDCYYGLDVERSSLVLCFCVEAQIKSVHTISFFISKYFWWKVTHKVETESFTQVLSTQRPNPAPFVCRKCSQPISETGLLWSMVEQPVSELKCLNQCVQPLWCFLSFRQQRCTFSPWTIRNFFVSLWWI